LLTVLLAGIGISLSVPSLDYLLVPMLCFFVVVGAYGWLRQGNKRTPAAMDSADVSSSCSLASFRGGFTAPEDEYKPL
jgi:hypothetical protein